MPKENILLVTDALVLPVRGIDGGFSCGVFDASDSAVPGSIHRSSTRPVTPTPAKAPAQEVGEEIGEALFGGIMLNHFGHFLMESLGRLWGANDEDVRHLPIIVQMPWGGMPLTDLDHFSRIILDLLEIDPARLKVVTAPLRVGKLHVPAQLYGFHCFENPSPIFIDFLRVAQRNILKMAEGFTLPSSCVYMSRSEWQDKAPKRGIVAGSHAFDDFLRQQGWHVVQPETLTFRDQLKIYAMAEHVLISEGSAQHSYILLPDTPTQVTVLLRRPDPWDITRVTKQFGGVGSHAATIQEIEKTYSYGQPSWSGMTVVDYTKVAQALYATGTVAEPFAAWESQKDEQVRQSLRTYIEAIREEPSFLDFMRKL